MARWSAWHTPGNTQLCREGYWRSALRIGLPASKNETGFDAEPKASCRELMALLKSEPNHFVSQLEQSVARAVTKPWGVQVATGFNRDQALATYARAMSGSNALISWKEDPKLQPILFRSRGTSNFYQVRNRHRHASRGRQSLQADPPCSRRLSCEAKKHVKATWRRERSVRGDVEVSRN